jgi:hypothetical protein
MAYRQDTVASIVRRLNVQYFLPAIQREFVWGGDKIVSLFDSILRGYPISSFLFWGLEPESRGKWQVYKFVQNATKGITHNELASLEGVPEPILVLDGQQRLTAFLIGLRGTFTTRKKYGRKSDPDAWEQHQLYLDLLRNPDAMEDDDQTKPYFGLQFFKSEPRNTDTHHWLRVGLILNCADEDQFFEFRQRERETLPKTATTKQLSVFERNLDRLYRAVWKNEDIVYYIESRQDYDRVLDIFIRANERGVPLSKSDLLLSMVISKWTGMNARDEIFRFVERLNRDLTSKNDFSKDFVLKSSLVLCDLPVAYRVQNFTNANLALIQSNWGNIKKAIEKGVDIANYFGIYEDTLTSTNALIPIIYYFYRYPEAKLYDETPAGVRNATGVRRWLTMALLNNVFSGSSDSTLTAVRSAIRENAPQAVFPVESINNKLAESGRTARFDEAAIDRFLRISYRDLRAFLALSILYPENNWGTMVMHKDHIFPRALFSLDAMLDAGFSTEQWAQYDFMADRVANLELLLVHENQEKSGMPFEEWITTRDSDFRKRHLIPDDSELWKFENFPRFLEQRERLIRERLALLFGPLESGEGR